MPRFQRNIDSDLPNSDGMIQFTSTDMALAGGGATGTLTRIALGEWSLRVSTTTPGQIAIPIGGVMLRYGTADDTQNVFGSARSQGPQGGSQAQAIGWPNTLSTST